MAQKIKKGDTVQVVSGNENGNRGTVIRIDRNQDSNKTRVAVEGLNIRKKHQKQMQTQGNRQLPSGIIEFEGSVNLSNVMIVCSSCDQPVRVGFRFDDSGNRIRVCRKCDGDLD